MHRGRHHPVYRTEQFSGTTDDTSADEMGLVYQYELLAADITAGYITFTDSITDALRGATLYTSPSQEGIAQANDRPPLAKDIALHKNAYMIYGNCSTKQRLFFTLVGAGTLTGKTITLGGVTYNFGASEITSGGGSPQALVSATGVAAVDIDLTARSLVRVINRYASNTSVYAYYLTGPSDLPGQILIEEKGVGASAFTLQASDTAIAAMMFPAPPVSPATNTKSTSTNAIEENMVYYAKANQPEHVPPLNKLPAGPSNQKILRVIGLRESTIIIKEDGVYRLTGETPSSFTIVPLDTTVKCVAANSVVALANQVFMLSNQGVVAITDSGVQVVSHEIEPKLTPLLTVASLADYTSACAYESERFYILSTITSTSDTAANQTFVFNIFTRTWVQHRYAFKAALVGNGDKMYFAKPSSAVVYAERKSFSDADFADPELSITISSLGTDTIDVTSSTAPKVGWVVSQNSSELVITEVLVVSGGYRLTLESTVPGVWTTGAADLYPAVNMEIEWQAWTATAPDVLKQVRQVAILSDDSLEDNSATGIAMTFRSNFDPELAEVPIAQDRAAWGAAWGSTPWGGSGDPVGYPTYVPRNQQYCTRLHLGVKHTYARQKLVVAGCAFVYEACSDRIGR
jgi:hypothetical protein